MAADPGTGIITDEKQTGSAGVGNSDAAVAVEFEELGDEFGVPIFRAAGVAS